MGTLRTSLYFVALATVVACSGSKAKPDAAVVPDAPPDAKPIDAPPDGPTYDLSCIGNGVGPVAATVKLSGMVSAFSFLNKQLTPLAGATVDACKGNCVGGNRLDTQTTDAAGAFATKALTTGGAPLAGYMKMTHTGDTTVFAYPASPVTQDISGIPILTFSTQDSGLLSQICGQTVDKGVAALILTDCMTKRIDDNANVVLSLKQGGVEVTGTTVLYGGTLSPLAAGLYLVCNIPAGVTTVNATYNGMTFLAHDVTVSLASMTETQIRPGH